MILHEKHIQIIRKNYEIISELTIYIPEDSEFRLLTK